MAVKDIDYEFFEDPPEELTCSICIKELREPHLVNCCGQQFCKDCLEKWLLKDATCPHCRKKGLSHMLMHQTKRKVRELKVYCPNNQHGCKAVLKIRECEDHLSTTNDRGCAYVRLDCPNACTAELFRGEMETHTQKECPRRTVACPHCDLQGEHQHIAGDHSNECPLYPLPCPLGCEATVLRKDREAHRDDCPLEPVLCPLHELGCKTTVCRRDLAEHTKTSALQHLAVLARCNSMLRAQCATAAAQYAALQVSYAQLSQSLAALHAQHATVAAHYVAVKAENKVQGAELANLRQSQTEMENSLATLTASHNVLQFKHATLQESQGTLEKSHADMAYSHMTLQEEMAALPNPQAFAMQPAHVHFQPPHPFTAHADFQPQNTSFTTEGRFDAQRKLHQTTWS